MKDTDLIHLKILLEMIKYNFDIKHDFYPDAQYCSHYLFY